MSASAGTPGETPYSHPWRTARNRSLIDTLLHVVLGAMVFSLPLEGFVIEGGRTFTYYLSILALGLVFFRLPILIRNLIRAPGMLLLAAAFGLGVFLYFIRPIGNTDSLKVLLQLLLMAAMFMYAADLPDTRRRFLWIYWVAWTIFVTASLVQVLIRGVDAFNVAAGGQIRIELFNYSIAAHSGQVGAGLALAIPLALSTRSLKLRGLVAASVVAGSLTLLFGGTRGALLGLVAAMGTWFIIAPFARQTNKTASSRSKAITFLILLIGVFVVLTQTEIGSSLVESMGLRLTQTVEEGDVASRDVLYVAAVQIFAENPMGVGYGNVMPLIGWKLRGTVLGTHNHYLQVLVESGVGGAILLFLGLALILRRGLRWYLLTQENYFFPMIFLLFYAATVDALSYKIAWFFFAMNALTPLSAGQHVEPDDTTPPA